MLYVGIDCHKRYAQVNAIDEKGKTRVHTRLSNDLSTLVDFFRSLNEPCKALLEAGWNRGLMYDWLQSHQPQSELRTSCWSVSRSAITI